MLRSPAIYMINHNNDIFVQVKRGESLGKLIDLRMVSVCRQPVTEGERTASKPAAVHGRAGPAGNAGDGQG